MNQLLAGPSKRFWCQRGFLFALAAAQLVAVIWVGRNGGFRSLAARVREMRVTRPQVTSLQEWQVAMARDPKPGVRLPEVTLKDSEGGLLAIRASNRSGGLLFINSCTDCVAGHVATWDQFQRQHPEVDLRVVPVSPDIDLIRRFRQAHRLRIPFVVEGSEKLYEVCSPFFLPRAYLFDRQAKLTYVQPPSVSTGAALQHVERVLLTKVERRQLDDDAHGG